METWQSRYPSLLADWSKRGLAQHFPTALPTGAAPAKVSSTPGFLQGGGWLQIRCTLAPAEVATAFDQASKEAKAFYDGGTEFELANAHKDGLPGTRFHTADTEDQSFPPDYRVFIYDARS
ncbi:MAG TPA: hypothetical protein VFG14_15280 [Chthoniobacteraceae bacterium]|nr:hypothetical protein [Chthoniobacteraceae bacterium]